MRPTLSYVKSWGSSTDNSFTLRLLITFDFSLMSISYHEYSISCMLPYVAINSSISCRATTQFYDFSIDMAHGPAGAKSACDDITLPHVSCRHRAMEKIGIEEDNARNVVQLNTWKTAASHTVPVSSDFSTKSSWNDNLLLILCAGNISNKIYDGRV